jgi:hypothetical protein
MERKGVGQNPKWYYSLQVDSKKDIGYVVLEENFLYQTSFYLSKRQGSTVIIIK